MATWRPQVHRTRTKNVFWLHIQSFKRPIFCLSRMGCFKRTASKHVYYQGWNRSPAQVGCMRQALGPGALGRPRGIGWRGRWEGGIGMGNTCKSMADSCQCMTKPLQYCKVISLQLIKINGKKNKVWIYWLVDLATPFLTYIWDKCVCVCVHAQLCLTLCNPMNCSLLGYSVHMILQAGILEWIVIPFSRACSQPRDWTCLSCDSWI